MTLLGWLLLGVLLIGLLVVSAYWYGRQRHVDVDAATRLADKRVPDSGKAGMFGMASFAPAGGEGKADYALTGDYFSGQYWVAYFPVGWSGNGTNPRGRLLGGDLLRAGRSV